MADVGIKVTLDGYSTDILPDSAANIKKFALISSVNLLKIKLAARVSIASGVQVDVAHGLSYKPLFWCFFRSGSDMKPAYRTQDRSGTAFVDSTNLSIKNTGSTADFYYYIFHDPA